MFLMRAAVPGSIPGADNLDSGFQPSGVGKVSSSKYAIGDRYNKPRSLIARPLSCAAQIYSTWFTLRLARALEVTLAGWLFKALQRCSSLTLNFHLYSVIHRRQLYVALITKISIGLLRDA